MMKLAMLACVFAVSYGAAASGPNDETMFFCDFKDPSICGLQVWHEDNASLRQDGQESFLNFTLTPGQRIMFALPEPVNPSGIGPICVRLEQRRGSLDEAGTSDNVFKIHRIIGDEADESAYDMKGDKRSWSPSGAQWTISEVGDHDEVFTRDPLRIWFTFQVPSSSSTSQFLHVRQLHVYNSKDRC